MGHSPQDQLEPHVGLGGRPTRKMPGSPLTGDQRPLASPARTRTHAHTAHAAQSHTQHATPTPDGHPGRCEIPRRDATSATRGFPKAATSPGLPSLLHEFKRPRGEQDRCKCAAGFSWKQQLACSFIPPPPPTRRRLDMWPRGPTPTQETEVRKSRSPEFLGRGAEGAIKVERRGEWGGSSRGQTAARNKPPRVVTSRRKPPNLPRPQEGPSRGQRPRQPGGRSTPSRAVLPRLPRPRGPKRRANWGSTPTGVRGTHTREFSRSWSGTP